MLCELHKVEMNWKTGISQKTGNPYAFWSCSKKMPNGDWCTFKPPREAPAPSPVAGPLLLEELRKQTVLLERLLANFSPYHAKELTKTAVKEDPIATEDIPF